MLISLALLTLPSWIARFWLRRERFSLKVLGDVGIGACFLLFMQIPFLPLIVIPILQFLILIDGFLKKKLKLRLEQNFFYFLAHYKEFKDSARKIRLYPFMMLSVGISLLSLFSYSTPFTPWLMGIAGLTFLGFWGEGMEPHLLLYYFFSPKKKIKKDVDTSSFLSKTALSKPISSSYPLYRHTEKFLGEKAFDFKINKGKKPNVIFLFVESLGAHNLEKGKTPHLEKISREGVYFPKFYSNSFQTFRSLYASLLGIPYDPSSGFYIDTSIPTTGLIQILKKNGYKTHFINAATWSFNNLKRFLQKQGADTIHDKREILEAIPDAEETSWGVFDEPFFDYALKHIVKNKNAPQFYSLMTISTHHPYMLPKKMKRKQRGSDYENFMEILSYSDACIGEFLNGLEREKILDNALLFVMGDHGNPLNKTSAPLEFSDQEGEQNYHVPLVIYGKSMIPKGQVIKEAGCQSDLLLTLIDMLELQGYHHSTGASLLRKESHPILMYNFSNPASDFRMRYGDEVKGKMDPLATSYRDLLVNLHRDKKLLPETDLQLASLEYAPRSDKSEEEILKELGELDELYSVSLNQNVTDKTIEYIAKSFPGLGVFTLKGNYLVTDDALLTLIDCCKELVHLELAECLLLSQRSMIKALQIPTLMILALEGMDVLNDELLEKIDFKSEQLCSISLVNSSIKDLSKVSRMFPSLNSANFSFSKIDQESLIAFLKSQPLTTLCLYECESMDDPILLTITAASKNLGALTLNHCYSLTDKGFAQFNHPKVETLSLKAPTSLTDKGLESLMKIPLKNLLIQDAVSLTEEGMKKARLSSSSYVQLKVEGGTCF